MLWLLWLLPMVGGYSLVFQCPEMCLCDSEITSCQYSGLTELPSDINFNVSIKFIYHLLLIIVIYIKSFFFDKFYSPKFKSLHNNTLLRAVKA